MTIVSEIKTDDNTKRKHADFVPILLFIVMISSFILAGWRNPDWLAAVFNTLFVDVLPIVIRVLFTPFILLDRVIGHAYNFFFGCGKNPPLAASPNPISNECR